MIQILLIMMAINVALLIWLFMEFYAFKMRVDKNFEFLSELCSEASKNKCMLDNIPTNPIPPNPFNGGVMPCDYEKKEKQYNPDDIEGIFDSFFEESQRGKEK